MLYVTSKIKHFPLELHQGILNPKDSNVTTLEEQDSMTRKNKIIKLSSNVLSTSRRKISEISYINATSIFWPN